MKKNKLKQTFKLTKEGIELALVPNEYETTAGYGKPYPELQEDKRKITLDQDKQDKRELHHENLKEMLKHHEGAVKNVKAEIAALEKDMKEDEGDIRRESDAATDKQKAAQEKFMEMIRKKKGGDKKDADKEEKDDDKKTKKKEASKAASWEKTDEKELKRDTKKQKVEHEKDAIEDDKSKIKNLKKGKPSEKKDAEKKALKRDMKFDEDSKKKMEGDYGGGEMKKKIKPKKSYAQMLIDIAAERFGGKKRSALKDSDFLDPKRRSFPVMSAQDVKDAVSSWGRYKGSMTFDEFKAKLTRRAKKIGAESALPKSWTEKK